MPFKIIRNDITKMNTEAIVNTANDHAAVGTGCDSAVYEEKRRNFAPVTEKACSLRRRTGLSLSRFH